LSAIIGTLPSEGLTTEKIIALLRKDHAKDIEAEASDLIDIALIKLVSQIGSIRSGSTRNIQSELFEEYGVRKRLVLRVKTSQGSEKIWKDLDDISIAEAERYISDRLRPRQRIAEEVNELKRLVAYSKPYAKSDSDKLVKAWAAAWADNKKP
jgi:hypothetical protein